MHTTTLITGATRGIGKSIANRLMLDNHSIINISKTGIIPKDIGNGNFVSYKCDISNIENTHELVTQLTNKYKIDNIILNSGITSDRVFHKMSISEWSRVINTNLLSVYGILNPVINQMRKNEKGNIIFISSVNAHRPVIGQSNYSASKNGLISINRCLAIENASKNIKCNVISPGYIETDMVQQIKQETQDKIKNEIPMKRFGTTNEIANLAAMLTTDSHYFQGANFDVNGGLFIR
jgi:NAD(P)-dependent dehydrogenase (short-subunit alcohol dehydrogenase family)